MTDTIAVDRAVRLAVYRHFVDEGTAPVVDQVAEAAGIAPVDAEASFRRLEASRALVFAPGTLDIWMAAPFSATPTPFLVESGGRSWWGNCIWDGLGVLAMLATDGTVSTFCPDCDEPFELRVDGGELAPVDGVTHFAVPVRRWWEDIGFT